MWTFAFAVGNLPHMHHPHAHIQQQQQKTIVHGSTRDVSIRVMSVRDWYARFTFRLYLLEHLSILCRLCIEKLTRIHTLRISEIQFVVFVSANCVWIFLNGLLEEKEFDLLLKYETVWVVCASVGSSALRS